MRKKKPSFDNIDNKALPDNIEAPRLNRHQRRRMQRTNRKTKTTRLVKQKEGEPIVYHDDSYIDKTKRVVTHGMQYVRERLARKNATFDLPEHINTVRRKLLTRCVIINREGRERTLLPDRKPVYKILVHGNIANVLVSKVCMLVRIAANRTKEDDRWLDGSWAITPAEYRMMNETTVQKCRRRSWFFLRRYWYEIDFDGRVQPAHLLFDYEMDPAARKTKLWITREYVPIADTDQYNDYFRFWRNRPPKEKHSDGVKVEKAVQPYDPTIKEVSEEIISYK